MTHALSNIRTEVVRTLALALLFGILAYLAIVITGGEDRIAAIWLPNAVLVAVILRQERANPYLICAAFAANILANLGTGQLPLHAVGLAMANSIEISIICVAMRRLGLARWRARLRVSRFGLTRTQIAEVPQMVRQSG